LKIIRKNSGAQHPKYLKNLNNPNNPVSKLGILFLLFGFALNFYNLAVFVCAARHAGMVRFYRLTAFGAFLQVNFFERIVRPASSHFA
jgi:hypothetical protein